MYVLDNTHQGTSLPEVLFTQKLVSSKIEPTEGAELLLLRIVAEQHDPSCRKNISTPKREDGTKGPLQEITTI